MSQKAIYFKLKLIHQISNFKTLYLFLHIKDFPWHFYNKIYSQNYLSEKYIIRCEICIFFKPEVYCSEHLFESTFVIYNRNKFNIKLKCKFFHKPFSLIRRGWGYQSSGAESQGSGLSSLFPRVSNTPVKEIYNLERNLAASKICQSDKNPSAIATDAMENIIRLSHLARRNVNSTRHFHFNA